MPSFPPLGSVTVCEINRDLITVESLSDDRAKETYGKILGIVFSPIPLQLDLLFPNSHQGLEQGSNGVPNSEESFSNSLSRSKWSLAMQMIQNYITPIFPPMKVNLPTEIDLRGLSWHQHKHILALISGPNQVSVVDYEDLECKDPCILTSESQKGIQMVEWRPNGGRTLSVACEGGICIWSASYPGNQASVRTGVPSFLGALSRGSGVRWTVVDFLKSSSGEQVRSISWSPNGRYLASASCESSSFIIWDVAKGLGTPIRRGLGGISMLKWSPSGDYFFTAKLDGTFYLWETNMWTSEPWSSTGGFVTGAEWDPDGHMILIAFSESITLGSVHFVSRPPSLDAHLLPVDLPEIASRTGSHGIEKIAWDASGERLALSFKDANENYAGLIAVYDICRTPLVSASFIGFIRGPGENPKPLMFAFNNNFKQGPLLSVCWSSGWCCTYPLIVRSHLLP